MRYNAHRGLSSKAPENTLSAFELVTPHTHYQAFELDIHTSKDGVFVVCHDDDLKRMTHHKGLIKEMTYDEIKTHKIVSGHGVKTYANQYMPRLEEVLDVALKHQKIAQIEIKSVHDITQLFELMELIESYPLLKAEIISFDLNYLKYIRALSAIDMFYLGDHIDDALLYDLRVHDIHVGLDKDVITLAVVKQLKKQGFKVLAYTVDDPKEAIKLTQMGIDQITTNKL